MSFSQGWRPLDNNGKVEAFEFRTYLEVANERNQLGSGLLHLGLCAPLEDGYQLMGIFSRNRYECVLTELACNAYKMITVPLYDTLDADTISFILDQTKMKAICCGSKEADMLISIKKEIPEKMVNFNRIVQFEDVSEGERSEAQKAGISLMSLAEVKDVGSDVIKDHRIPQPKDLTTILYTSGTTGNPKGAMLTHKNVIANSCGLISANVSLDADSVHLSYLPFAQPFERIIVATVLTCGGRIGFRQGDSTNLVNDLTALRPTIFLSLPYLLRRIYDKISMLVESVGGIKKWLFDMALDSKRYYLERNSLAHSFWDSLIFNKLKTDLGLDRCELIISVAASISPSVTEFLRCTIGVPVLEGYGQTECSAGATVSDIDDHATLGHVGPPLACNQIRLQSVEGRGYWITDKQHGNTSCFGRGEICIKGDNVFKGYYKDPEKTHETLNSGGWLNTGDVGFWDTYGNLHIIDEVKYTLMLSQGKYVAVEKVENAYTESRFVGQIFVYGDNFHP